ncbi:MAG: type II toxin-antitoxin system ParD family antitoxin [Ancrocorticia sp.]
MSQETDRNRDMLALRAALIAGEGSGEPEEFNFEEFIAFKKKQ